MNLTLFILLNSASDFSLQSGLINERITFSHWHKPIAAVTPGRLFADHLEENLTAMNNKFREIRDLFAASGVENFERLPDSVEERAMFAKLFRQFNASYEAARIQGFAWVQLYYQFQHENGEITDLTVALTETTYLILALRYKELFSPGGGGLGPEDDIPYEIDTYLTEINTDRTDYTDADPDIEKDFYMLRHTLCPAVLTENLFMDNVSDYTFLLSDEGRQAIVDLHVDGILNYISQSA